MKPSRGTVWPPDILAIIRERDPACVGRIVGMPGDCFGGLEPDHVRASGGVGMKSRSTVDNGAMLCSTHHRLKTNEGRTWRPKLIDYINGVCPHVDPNPSCEVCTRRALYPVTV
jgi:hypothetical protein